MKYTLSFIAASLVATGAFAQSTDTNINTDSDTQLETITVLGSRIQTNIQDLPGSVSIIDTDFIEASGAVFVTDLLRSVAGMNVSQSGPNGTLTEIRFRGSESNHILVLIDGVEINDLGQGGIADFAHLQANDIQRIELLRGPQSALWGANAVSGVINIITKGANAQRGTKLNANASLGTQDTQKLGLSLARGTEDSSLGLNFSHYQSDGFNIAREGDTNANTEKDAYKNTSFGANYRHRVNSIHTVWFNTRIASYESDFDATDFFVTGLPVDANNLTQGTQASAQLKWQITPTDSALSHHASLQYNEQEVTNYSDELESGATKGTKTRLNWISSYAFADANFVNLGLDWVDENFEQAGPVVFGDPNQSQNNQTASLVSDGRVFINDNINATYSLRFDNSDEFDNASSYRLGVNAVITDQLKVYIARAKAVKNPTFTERFGFFPQTFIGNPDLSPESSLNHEVGLVYAYDNNQVSVSYFDTELENEINGFVFVPEAGSFTAQNSDLISERKGIEVSAAGQAGDLDWQVNYAYLDAKDPLADELRRANHSASVALNYAYNSSNTVFLQADYTGSRSDQFFPPFPNPSQIVGLGAYWLVSANYSYDYSDSLNLSLRATNLTDTDFEDVFGFVGQGRQVSFNIRYSLN